MKKLIFPLALSFALVSLAGCNKYVPKPGFDDDFDGLLNEVDPEPLNNNYTFHFCDHDGTTVMTNKDNYIMDYREFFRDDLQTTYNYNLSKIGALLSLESYGRYMTYDKNEYISDSSNISKLLTQIGCTDIVLNKLVDVTYDTDADDFENYVVGHHLVTNGDKKLNITFLEIKGYTKRTGWSSNFDVGSDCDGYEETTGLHPDWTDKKLHKGFSVTANRIYQGLKIYVNEHKTTGVDDLVFVAGHSRTAAVASLIGKNLKDDNINSLVYGFNTPTHICETEETLRESYTNIWQLINEDDFISCVPLPSWNNFSHLGHILKYKMSDHKNVFSSYFTNRVYPNCDDNLIPTISNALRNIITERDDFYNWRPASAEYKEVILDDDDIPFETEQAARDAIEELWDAFDNKEAVQRVLSMTVEPYSGNADKFQISYKTKPHIIDLIVHDVTVDPSTLNILTVLRAYLPFMGRYLDDVDECLSYILDDLQGVIDQFFNAHFEMIMLVGINLFK